MIKIQKYGYFGVVELTIDMGQTSIEITDNLSKRHIQIVVDVQMIQVELMEECVVFLSNDGKIYAYKHAKQDFYLLESILTKWEWKSLAEQYPIKITKLEMDLTQQWKHWEKLNSVDYISQIENHNEYQLACTMFGIYFVQNAPSTSTESFCILEKIYDSRGSKTLKKIENLNFRICGGNDHLTILDTDGIIWTCGSGNHGELGIDQLESHEHPVCVELLRSEGIQRITDISAGGWHSCALTGILFTSTFIIIEDGDVYGWGWNRHGQLGLEDEV